jgi:hypothetical protein
MQRNINKRGVIVRLIAAAVIIGLGIGFKSWWGLVGIMPLAVAITGVCPLNSMRGINENSPKAKEGVAQSS